MLCNFNQGRVCYTSTCCAFYLIDYTQLVLALLGHCSNHVLLSVFRFCSAAFHYINKLLLKAVNKNNFLACARKNCCVFCP